MAAVDKSVFEKSLGERLMRGIARFAQAAQSEGGRLVVVGGAVRDALLGRRSNDADCEVFGIEAARLERCVAQFAPVNLVGKSFGVLKVRGLDIDISLPRREARTGERHKDFFIDSDPHMSFKEAAMRRDFTLNAISWDPLNGEIIDPFGGVGDLKSGILRHTSPRFAEDPLRVLRAMQFLARFTFALAPETLALCRTLGMEALSKERVEQEWKKLLVKGVRPSLGLEFLRDCGWVRFFPELEALIGCPQDPQWHPEGDVWTHTLQCLDAFAARRCGQEREDWVVGLGVLCHDFGKPLTTTHDADGHIRSLGHETAGEAPTRSFLARLTQEKDLTQEVVVLVTHHMRVLDLWRNKAGDSAIRRLAHRVGRIDRLVRIDDADRRGRLPLVPEESPQGLWLTERAQALALKDSAPKPIVMGRHLIAFGVKPSPLFKKILSACFEAQLDGAFKDEAQGLAFLKKELEKHRNLLPDPPPEAGN